MFHKKGVIFILVLIAVGIVGYFAYKHTMTQTTYENKMAVVREEGKFLITLILRHDQSKTLNELQKKLTETGFYKNFPPDGIKIESWKVVMGIGQIITLEVPANKLRDVNIAVEKMAWGAFRTEFYPTYDFLQIYNSFRDTTVKDSTNNIRE